MQLTHRVYSMPVTGALFDGARLRGATVESAKAGRRTFWQWLKHIFSGEDDSTCDCAAAKRKEEQECRDKGGDLVDWSCETADDGTCMFSSRCTSSHGWL